ncbi:MAG: tetratricopeptide repeat protein [Candidatus Magnetominusculus sp. LBB02]|nr:tetratricopeptide repeat protein [Candidatus Magnetominusculus sp. LBB02]
MKDASTRNYITMFFLAAAVFIAYMPLKDSGFVSLDDLNYVTLNSYIKDGVTLKNIQWAFTSTYFANWHPVTWASHMTDISLYGLSPMGHHLMSVVFHAFNTVILFELLRLMTGKNLESALAAALFALHPLAVESVAWVSERKNVLSTFFWLLSIAAYVYYVKRPTAARYEAALLSFALSLMSKPMAVTLPFTLLLVDYWPLGRFQTGRQNIAKIITEKLPFILLSIISGIITILVQQKDGAIISLQSVPIGSRLINAVTAYWDYLEKMAYPAALAVFYPQAAALSVKEAALKGAALLSITVSAYILRKRAPHLLMGWLWYVVTLLPVIQIIQVGGAAMADRYAYVPLIGIYVMICFGVGSVRQQTIKRLLVAAFAVVIVVFAGMTWRQAWVWKNSGTLFKHATLVTKGNYVAYNEYGMYLVNEGRLDEAIEAFTKGLEAAPDNSLLNFNMWEALTAKGLKDEAKRYYAAAVARTNPSEPSLFKARGIELMRAKNFDKASQYLLIALQAAPNDAEIYNYLGLLLGAQRKYEAALECFNNGIKIMPSSWELHFHRGLVLKEMGKEAEAVQSFRESQRLNPDAPIVGMMLKKM